jgi:hypothetical protein
MSLRVSRPRQRHRRMAVPVGIGVGWATFDALAATGDLTDDGAPDVVAPIRRRPQVAFCVLAWAICGSGGASPSRAC